MSAFPPSPPPPEEEKSHPFHKAIQESRQVQDEALSLAREFRQRIKTRKLKAPKAIDS